MMRVKLTMFSMLLALQMPRNVVILRKLAVLSEILMCKLLLVTEIQSLEVDKFLPMGHCQQSDVESS